MSKLFDIAIPYSYVNKTSEFILHLDCLDPVENEKWASWPFFT